MRRAAKRDISEPEIVNTLKQCGFRVCYMDRPVDLLVGFRGKLYLVECKTDKGKLTVGQAKFLDEWKGFPIYVLHDAQEAMDFAVSVARGDDGKAHDNKG